MLTQEALDLLNEPKIKKVYDPAILKLPAYKEHLEGNIHYLDVDVTLEQFKNDTNFDGAICYRVNDDRVIGYVEDDFWDELCIKFREIEGMKFASMYYEDGLPEVVIENFYVGDGWFATINFLLNGKRGSIEFKADTGATFSVVNLKDLSTHLNVSEQDFKHLLNTKNYSLVTVHTAGSDVSYFAVTMVFTLFNEDVPVVVYVDPQNRLRKPLLGFDIITSLDLIAKPGKAPVALSFSREVNSKYIKDHHDVDNATVDLYTLYLETQS